MWHRKAKAGKTHCFRSKADTVILPKAPVCTPVFSVCKTHGDTSECLLPAGQLQVFKTSLPCPVFPGRPQVGSAVLIFTNGEIKTPEG